MSEFSDSFKKIFEERISSPFYGSLIISWLLWNWRIPYVTFFVDQDKLGTVERTINGVLTNVYITNKIDYIIYKCSNLHHLITFPLISTAVILLLMPFITNGAYWITLIFDKWRVDKKNVVEKKRLLSLEESLRITTEMLTQKEEFADILKSKNDEILSLKNQLEVVIKENKPQNKEKPAIDLSLPTPIKYRDDLKKFFLNSEVVKHYEILYNDIKRTNVISAQIPSKVEKFCVAYQLIVSIR